MTDFEKKMIALRQHHEELLRRKNSPKPWGNGIYEKYENPILTAEHTPLEWRYDFCEKDNPFLMQRIMMNATLNSGAIKWDGPSPLGETKGSYVLVVRVEGADRKSFFAVAESPNGVDNFRFWPEPITMPEAPLLSGGVGGGPATNIYDMRLTKHEDGWIYGVFCAERHDNTQPGNLSAATATAGIARTKDLINWERLPDLVSRSQQRNVVLHPEFVDGKYAFYTRPQDGFIDTGSGGGIGWALVDDITHAVVKEEIIINARHYHTITEVKNGEGPHPIKTPKGWLHLAHGVRGTADGLRYVLYMYMTALDDPTRVIAQPGGFFLVPEGSEYVGDVMNVAFANGWIADPDGRVFIYYASADTRMHVATSTIDRLIDYCMNTPEDGLTTAASVETIKKLIKKNQHLQSTSFQNNNNSINIKRIFGKADIISVSIPDELAMANEDNGRLDVKLTFRYHLDAEGLDLSNYSGLDNTLIALACQESLRTDYTYLWDATKTGYKLGEEDRAERELKQKLEGKVLLFTTYVFKVSELLRGTKYVDTNGKPYTSIHNERRVFSSFTNSYLLKYDDTDAVKAAMQARLLRDLAGGELSVGRTDEEAREFQKTSKSGT